MDYYTEAIKIILFLLLRSSKTQISFLKENTRTPKTLACFVVCFIYFIWGCWVSIGYFAFWQLNLEIRVATLYI